MSPAQGFSRKALRWGREQVWRWAGWPAALWVLLAVLSRWPLRGRWLYHWDSVNFALALDHFDVARGQPHIPGYPLYVGMGRISRWIFGEAQTALVALSVLGTALGAILIDRLGREWGGPRVGRWAALFWLSSPLVWFYGDVALPHALDAGLILLVVWLAWRCTQGERLHRPLALALAFAAGLRPQNLGFLGPVFLWGLSGQPWRRRGESLLWLAAFTLAWLIPLLALSGGLQAYLAISRAYNAHFWSATLVFGPAGLAALQRNGTKLIAYTAYGLAGAGLALLALRQALPAIRLPSPAFRRIGIGVLLWVTPSLAFYTLIHMGQQGLVLVFLPALLLGAAAAVERGGRWGRSLGMIGVLMNLLLFLAAPERPLGPNGIRLLNREALRRHDATLEARFALLREQFPPERTLVIASQWRFFDAYAPAYRVLPFGLDDPAERPSETWVFFRTEAMGTGAVVLFEPELVRWVRSGSRPWEWFEGAGTRLPGWRWPPGTEWVYGPQGFGLFEGVGASAP